MSTRMHRVTPQISHPMLLLTLFNVYYSEFADLAVHVHEELAVHVQVPRAAIVILYPLAQDLFFHA